MTDEVALPEVVGKLCKPSRDLWTDTLSEYPDLDERSLHILLVCVEALHRRVEARQALESHGMVFVDRLGNFRPMPELAVERNSQTIFLKALRQLSHSLPAQANGAPYKRMGRVFYGRRRDQEGA